MSRQRGTRRRASTQASGSIILLHRQGILHCAYRSAGALSPQRRVPGYQRRTRRTQAALAALRPAVISAQPSLMLLLGCGCLLRPLVAVSWRLGVRFRGCCGSSRQPAARQLPHRRPPASSCRQRPAANPLSSLVEGRQEDPAARVLLPAVLPVEDAAQALVLRLGPHRHLRRPDALRERERRKGWIERARRRCVVRAAAAAEVARRAMKMIPVSVCVATLKKNHP